MLEPVSNAGLRIWSQLLDLGPMLPLRRDGMGSATGFDLQGLLTLGSAIGLPTSETLRLAPHLDRGLREAIAEVRAGEEQKAVGDGD